jgi:hypothetical protein
LRLDYVPLAIAHKTRISGPDFSMLAQAFSEALSSICVSGVKSDCLDRNVDIGITIVFPLAIGALAQYKQITCLVVLRPRVSYLFRRCYQADVLSEQSKSLFLTIPRATAATHTAAIRQSGDLKNQLPPRAYYATTRLDDAPRPIPTVDMVAPFVMIVPLTLLQSKARPQPPTCHDGSA